MKTPTKLEVVRGSGNIFRDFGMPDPETRQLKAMLAVQVVKALDARKLTVRGASEMTGIAAADFSRIRNAKLERFTVDRLLLVLARLDQHVEVSIKVKPNRDRLPELV